MLLTVVAFVVTVLSIVLASPINVAQNKVERANCPNGPFRCNGKRLEACDGTGYHLMWDCEIPDNPMVTCSLSPIRGCARASDLGWVMHSDHAGKWLGPPGATVNPLQTYGPTSVVQAEPQSTEKIIEAFKELGELLPISHINNHAQGTDNNKRDVVTNTVPYPTEHSNDVLHPRLWWWFPKPSKTSTIKSSTTTSKTSTAVSQSTMTTVTSSSSAVPSTTPSTPPPGTPDIPGPPHRTFFVDPNGNLPTVPELEGFNRIVISGYKNGSPFGHWAAMESDRGLFWQYENAGIRVYPSVIFDQFTVEIAADPDASFEYLKKATILRDPAMPAKAWHLDFEEGYEDQMEWTLLYMKLMTTSLQVGRIYGLSYGKYTPVKDMLTPAVSASYFHSHPMGNPRMAVDFDIAHIKFFGNGNAWTDCNTLVHNSTATGYTSASLKEIGRNTASATTDERGSKLALGKPIGPNTPGYMDMASLGRCFKQAHCDGIPNFSLWGNGDLSPRMALQEFNNGFNSIPCSL